MRPGWKRGHITVGQIDQESNRHLLSLCSELPRLWVHMGTPVTRPRNAYHAWGYCSLITL